MAFGGGLDDNDDGVMNEINMTPLVDVMLVLLIIFIIAVPVLTHTVKVDLPRASNQPDETRPETVTLSVTEGGKLHWNNEPIDEAQLELRLAEVAGRKPQPEVHIRGDRSVDYEHVIKAMAAAQRAGVLKLGFITEPNE
jgi:biopolymer transport protein ExbD